MCIQDFQALTFVDLKGPLTSTKLYIIFILTTLYKTYQVRSSSKLLFYSCCVNKVFRILLLFTSNEIWPPPIQYMFFYSPMWSYILSMKFYTAVCELACLHISSNWPVLTLDNHYQMVLVLNKVHSLYKCEIYLYY